MTRLVSFANVTDCIKNEIRIFFFLVRLIQMSTPVSLGRRQQFSGDPLGCHRALSAGLRLLAMSWLVIGRWNSGMFGSGSDLDFTSERKTLQNNYLRRCLCVACTCTCNLVEEDIGTLTKMSIPSPSSFNKYAPVATLRVLLTGTQPY